MPEEIKTYRVIIYWISIFISSIALIYLIFPDNENFEDFAFSKISDGEVNFLIVNFAGKGLALKYSGKVLIRDLVFDEPDKFVSSLPYISAAALSDGNKVVFQIDLMHLFGQEDQRNSESP